MNLNMSYFIGNILSPTIGQPEADDPTFAFTRKESNNLDLTNCPIRMEHDENMQVGKVLRSWNDHNGSKWIIGKLNQKTYMDRFANHAINKDPLTNTTYYTGLSLQHEHITHRASGKSHKKAIEVSLCVDPRRDDCRIAMVESMPNLYQSEKLTYKLNNISNKMSEQTPKVEQPQEQTVTKETVQSESQEADQLKMSPEKMMEVIIQLQKEKDEKEASTAAEKKELEELKAMLQKQEEDKFKKDQAKSMAMVRALTDQWASELDKESMTDAQKESIVELAKNYPRESMELLRVAHCASKKAKSTASEFESFKKMAEKTRLSEKFEAVMQKRKAPETPTTSVVHAASTKKKRKTDVQHFLTAMKQYNVSGSARDHMEKVSQIGYRKKRNTFY